MPNPLGRGLSKIAPGAALCVPRPQHNDSRQLCREPCLGMLLEEEQMEVLDVQARPPLLEDGAGVAPAGGPSYFLHLRNTLLRKGTSLLF